MTGFNSMTRAEQKSFLLDESREITTALDADLWGAVRIKAEQLSQLARQLELEDEQTMIEQLTK